MLRKRFTGFVCRVVFVSLIVHVPRHVFAADKATDHQLKADRPGPNIQELAKSNPDKDFADAKRNGDIYFLAMRGFTIEVPGINPSQEYLVKQVGKKVIEGTSDVVGGKQGRELHKKVRKYAARYNQLVAGSLLQEKEKNRH